MCFSHCLNIFPTIFHLIHFHWTVLVGSLLWTPHLCLQVEPVAPSLDLVHPCITLVLVCAVSLPDCAHLEAGLVFICAMPHWVWENYDCMHIF